MCENIIAMHSERTMSLALSKCDTLPSNRSLGMTTCNRTRKRTPSSYNSTTTRTFPVKRTMNQTNNDEDDVCWRTTCRTWRRVCTSSIYSQAVTLFVLLIISGLHVSTTIAEKYIDIDAYIRYDSVSNSTLNQLRGAEQVLEFSFRYCHDPGMLVYQEGGDTDAKRDLFFALGVNNQRLYLEWKVEADSLVELYIGDGTLQPNVTYSVAIFNLGSAFTGTTFATINNIAAPVNYLTPESQSALDMGQLLGELYIGGYSDINDLRVNTERLNGYLVTCIGYIKTSSNLLDLDTASSLVGIKEGCPEDFCAPPTVITVQTSSSYLSVDHDLTPGTHTVLTLRFRTSVEQRRWNVRLRQRKWSGTFCPPNKRCLSTFIVRARHFATSGVESILHQVSAGMIFYYGGPAYLTLYMKDGRLVLGLNTRGTGEGTFATTTVSGFDDGEWHYVRVRRDGAVASLEDDTGLELARVTYSGLAQTLNAGELFIGGVRGPGSITQPFPESSLPSLRACFEELRFVTYSISSEPPELIDFDTQFTSERNVTHGGCYPSQLCEPTCPAPSQTCDFECSCASGFRQISSAPLTCENIDDCAPDPCLNGATCVDGVQDYTCQCTLEFNKGKNCSIPNFCIPNQCQNGATCNDNLDGFNCTCPAGFEGQLCETEIDECLSNPCQNGALCVDVVAGYECSCLPGYTGGQCELDIDECASSPCANGATCTDYLNFWNCTCAPGWQGRRCTRNIDECTSDPCLNGATCRDLVNSYICDCVPGWEGVHCETDINECDFGFCQNGATCFHGVNSYNCVCPDGWEGKNCSVEVDECASRPCQNGATCTDAFLSYTCFCAPGFTGEQCQEDINECTSDPCLNSGTCVDEVNGYRCECPPIWSGVNCQVERDECESDPCRNGATCNDLVGFYTCDCAPGFEGVNCEGNVDECASSPCQNGAVCLDSANRFSCRCAPGFMGVLCETEINECLSVPCVNGATCRDLVNMFVCDCPMGYDGTFCSQEKDECASQPCLNDATCIDFFNRYECECAPGFEGTFCEINIDECLVDNQCKNGATCVDGINSHTCVCGQGFTGTLCEQDINECLSSPCAFGGQCNDLPGAFSCVCPPNFTGEQCELDVNECLLSSGGCHPSQTRMCNNTFGSFQCSCNPGFEGELCDIDINECASNPCLFGGECVDGPNSYSCRCGSDFIGSQCQALVRQCNFNPCGFNSVCVEHPSGGYTCYCEPGYYGTDCLQEINECNSSPCMNGGLCTDHVHGYNCTCLPGYEGINCQIDTPECASLPCQNGGYCTEPTVDSYLCQCIPGFEGVNCEINIDECSLYNPCEYYEICVDGINSFLCRCPHGFEGPLCQFRIDSCYSDPCLNGATCMDGVHRYDCICPYGYTGLNCEIDTDVCDPQPCFHGGSCVRFPSNGLDFTCHCAAGFTGPRCEGDIYDCLSDPCQNNGTCVENTNGKSGFTCECLPGYVGHFCQEVFVPCSSDPCMNGATCQNTTGGFECICLAGWTGVMCSDDVNECITSPCQNAGVCNNMRGSYECICGPFWTGAHCQVDVPECSAIPPVCQNGGLCKEQSGAAPVCECIAGFEGPTCETEVDECESDPCMNGATCHDLVGSFFCACVLGYEGPLCQTDINECQSSPCQNNANCSDLINGYICTCLEGFNGTNCESELNECSSDPCANGGTCINGINGYACECAPGFEGIHCMIEINECASNPCLNGGTCMDLISGYNCGCSAGYEGVICDEEINECSSSPCAFGVCHDFLDFYNCTCNPGYEGLNCELDIQECASNPCQNGATCLEPEINMYQCSCAQGTSGPLCGTVSQASFTGSGYIQLPPLAQLALEGTGSGGSLGRRRRAVDRLIIELSFVTTLSDGVLFYNEGLQSNGYIDHLALELYQGSLVASMNVGSESVAATASGNLNDGTPHSAVLTLDGTTLTLTIDEGSCPAVPCSVSLSPSVAGGPLELNEALYVGGVGPDASPYILSKLKAMDSFIGCIQNFTVNSQLQSLSQAAPPNLSPNPTAASASAPTPGCVVSTPCQSSPCQNGGRCMDFWLSYKCSCPLGFEGTYCEIQTLASFMPQQFLHFGANASGLAIDGAVETIKFSFTAGSPDQGLIMYMPSGLTVSQAGNASVIIQFLRLGGVLSSELTIPVSDGRWYSLELSIVEQLQLVIKVTDIESGAVQLGTILAPPSVDLVMPVLFGKLHPGGVFVPLSTNLLTTSSFTGCIRDLSVNGRGVGLQLATPYGSRTDPPQASPGCPREGHCFPSPCQNMGTCQPSWEGYTCDCTPDFVEPNCTEASSSTYNGASSYTRLVLDSGTIPFGDSFSIEFRTRDRSGIILLMRFFHLSDGQVDDMVLLIIDGVLQLQTYFEADLKTLVISGNVTNAEWQTVSIDRHQSYITVHHGVQNYTLQGNFPIHSATRNPIIAMLLGGTNTPGSPPDMFLQGCIRNPMVNGQRLHYLSELTNPQPGLTVSRLDVQTGCNSLEVCNPDPCPATAYCVDLWNAHRCDCRDGWEGPNCARSVDDCIGNQCQRGSTCVDGHMNYTCICPTGLTDNLCNTEINVCENNPCNADTTVSCTHVFPLDFMCVCQPGFTGKTCLTDERICTQNPCVNGGVCAQNYDNTQYNCTCPDFYEGTNCEVFNPCFRHECVNGAECVRNESFYLCNCPDGFYGNFCELTDACFAEPCQNGGICHRDGNTYTCQCSRYYRGRNCEEPINQCEVNPCANGGSCFHDLQMPQVNFTCVCLAGYTGDLCQFDIAECESSPCKNGGTCVESSTPGQHFFVGYFCQCIPGYTGPNCETDINECSSSPCTNGGTCSDMINEYQCQCPMHFAGINCQFDQRTCDLGLCQNNATCTDAVNNGFECSCPLGFGGTLCESIINTCANNPCLNGGSCNYVGPCDCTSAPMGLTACGQNEQCQRNLCSQAQHCNVSQDAFICDCTDTGYQGRLCEEDINECLSPGVCLNGGQCINENGTFSCNCSGTGFTGDFCTRNIDECQSQPCLNGATCIDNRPFFECKCDSGYEGRLCEMDSDECSSEPCQNGGKCQDQVNGYTCDCVGTGYEGSQCVQDVNECDIGQAECQNGATCRNIAGTYECRCTDQFTGTLCETKLDAVTANQLAIIVPLVIVLVLLAVLFVCAWWYLRQSRKMKGKYNPAKEELDGGMPLAAFELETDERLI